MIVSDRGGFLFVHNPKAGGMSMRAALAPWDDHPGAFDGWRPCPALGRRVDRMHLTLGQLRMLEPEIFALLETRFSFGFVRDPYQRLCSAFSQHLTLNTPILRDSIRGDRDVFFAVLNRFAPRALGPHAAPNDVKLTHFLPQHLFFHLDGVQLVEAVERLETPERWRPRVRALLGPDGPERRNENPDRGGARYEVERLSRETLDAVARAYARDFELFGFERLGAGAEI